METLVGIFRSRRQAEEAVSELRVIGIPDDAINLVTPAESSAELAAVPTTDAEAPGIGKTLSGYVGGVIGGSVGLGAGAGVASLFVPGVGTILAAGIGAAALLGVGGAAAGVAVGDATEKAMDEGVPRDDILFYRDLLRRGRSLVIVSVDTNESASAVSSVLHHHGSEDVDSARKEWQSERLDKTA